MWTRRGLIAAVVGVLCLGACASNRAADPQEAGQVRLAVESATAKRWDNGEVLLICRVVLDNQTGQELTVHSHFFSAFDGLELVVLDKNGRRLVRQGYTVHQSPYSATPQPFLLKKGRNERELGFPVSKIPKGLQEVRVQLKGTLPDSAYDKMLSSNVVPVNIK
jgi:hypothetical protein